MEIADERISALTRADLAEERERYAIGTVARLRESHHKIAMYFAMGLTNREVASATGYSQSRISVLHTSPAMVELIAQYQKTALESHRELLNEVTEQKLQIMIAADRHVRDHFDEHDERGELVPLKLAMQIAAEYGDRVGYGKQTTQTNLNVDFGSALEAAVARTARVLNAEECDSPPPSAGGGRGHRSVAPFPRLGCERSERPPDNTRDKDEK